MGLRFLGGSFSWLSNTWFWLSSWSQDWALHQAPHWAQSPWDSLSPPLALFPAHTCMHAFSLSKEINKAFKKLLRLDQLKINILFTGFLISANKSSPINYNFCVLFCFVLHFSQLIKKTDFEVELSCDAFFSGNPYTQWQMYFHWKRDTTGMSET